MAARARAARRPAARKSTAADAPHPALLGLARFLVRVLPGAVFLDAAYVKFVLSGLAPGEVFDAFWRHDYRPLVEAAIASPPRLFGVEFSLWGDFLSTFLLGSEGWERFVAGAILVFEVVLGLGLVLGAFTRLLALLGAVLVAAFGLSKATWLLTVNQTNWTLMALMLAAACLAAGRTLGLDALLARRVPRWMA